MSLNWNFTTDYIGTLYIKEDYHNGEGEKEYPHPIYDGNAFAIFTSEWEEEGKRMYNLYNFFADEKHAKNCLGLSKEYKGNNIFEGKKTRWELRRDSKNARKLAKMLIDTGMETTITMVNEKAYD